MSLQERPQTEGALVTLARSATMSECGRYRYVLTRTWNANALPLVWIMLNPSTADDAADDPTIRRCMAFASAWDFGGIVVCNLFALRATDPSELLLAADPIGRHNNEILRHVLTAPRGPVNQVPHAVAAWGVHSAAGNRAKMILEIAHKRLWCLGTNQNGSPKHPLYIPSDRRLVRFDPTGHREAVRQ